MSGYDAWLCREPELPEVCPQCGADNSDEDGNWLVPDAAPWCSTICQVTFNDALDEWERRAMTCPRCNHHFDDHTIVQAHDPEYGDYETYECPA